MRMLMTGAGGLLGGYLLRHLATTDHEVVAWEGTGRPVDLCDATAVARAWQQTAPEVVLHTAALSRLPQCHADPVRARRVNVESTGLLADLATRDDARLIAVSTDLVFDGEKGDYDESDTPSPLSVYGRSKLEGERAALRCPRCAVVRVSLLFGPTLTERTGFFDTLVRAMHAGQPITLYHDEWRTPLSLAVAARALVALAESNITGLLHLGGPERLSRLEMGQILADVAGFDSAMLINGSRLDVPGAEPRPRDTSLNSRRWRELFPRIAWPGYRDALRELLGA